MKEYVIITIIESVGDPGKASTVGISEFKRSTF